MGQPASGPACAIAGTGTKTAPASTHSLNAQSKAVLNVLEVMAPFTARDYASGAQPLKRREGNQSRRIVRPPRGRNFLTQGNETRKPGSELMAPLGRGERAGESEGYKHNDRKEQNEDNHSDLPSVLTGKSHATCQIKPLYLQSVTETPEKKTGILRPHLSYRRDELYSPGTRVPFDPGLPF